MYIHIRCTAPYSAARETTTSVGLAHARPTSMLLPVIRSPKPFRVELPGTLLRVQCTTLNPNSRFNEPYMVCTPGSHRASQNSLVLLSLEQTLPALVTASLPPRLLVGR